MDEKIDIELEDEVLDLNTPECIQAVNSLSPSFKPFLSGEKLLKYYEERELSEEQMKAMVKSVNDKTKEYLENHAEEAKEFLEKGKMPPCPSMTTMMGIVDKLFPETQCCPLWELFKRLEKSTGSKVTYPDKGVWTLRIDDKDTGIYLRTIENLWTAAIRFNHDVEESLELVEKLVLRKLGIKRHWWQFWN